MQLLDFRKEFESDVYMLVAVDNGDPAVLNIRLA